ncbi:MAG: cadherin repeat domain-containing protein [Pseudomonadota bacterium]
MISPLTMCRWPTLITAAFLISACGGGGGGGGAPAGGGGGTTNQPPSFSSATDFTFAENVIVTFTLTVTDPDSSSVTITEVGGGDSGLFSLDTNTGVITATTPTGEFDFEDPQDGNQDNVYQQEIRLSDGVNTVTETITVTITNVDEGPEFVDQPEFQLNENATGPILTFTAADPEGAAVSNFQITEISKLGEPVNAQRLLDAFALDAVTGELSVVIPFDAEVEGTQDVISIGVSASDGAVEGFGGVTIRLVDLPSRLTDAVRISGRDLLTPLGDTASAVGDIDGDGFDEVFVSERTDESGVETGYLLWGASLNAALAAGATDDAVQNLALADRVVITGDDRSQTVRRSRLTGVEVGDVDDDGRDDLLVLMREARDSFAVENDDNGPLAYLVWGSTLERGTTDSLSLTALRSTEGVSIGGTERPAAARLTGTGADLDGDDRDDVVLAAPDQGRVLVLFGDALEAAGGSINISTAGSSAVVTLQSEAPGNILQQIGNRLAVIDDLTADTVPELVIGGEGLEPAFESGVFVVDGALIAGAKGVSDLVNISAAANDAEVIEATVAEVTADSVATDGDADDDGLSDLVIGHRGNAGVTRVASVVYGATLAAAFGSNDEISLNFSSVNDGVAISDDGSAASQTIDVDPVAVQWIGDADGNAGDELLVAVPNESPLNRAEAGQLLLFSIANLTAGTADLRIDSTAPDAALVRVLQGYGTGIRSGRELFVADLDGDSALEVGTASTTAGSDASGSDTGAVVILSDAITTGAATQVEATSDLATTVVVEAP